MSALEGKFLGKVLPCGIISAFWFMIHFRRNRPLIVAVLF